MVRKSSETFLIEHMPRFSRRNQVIASAAGLTLVLSGCTPKGTDPTPGIFAPDPDPSATSSLEYYEGQYGECNPTNALILQDSPDLLEESAEDCLDVYEDSDIALIDYTGLSDKQVSSLAVDISDTLEQVTMGNINPEVTVIEPSAEALAAFEENTADGCIHTYDLLDYGSFIADNTMPELHDYDQLVSISDLDDCDLAAGGVQYGLYNRYAEVFNVSNKIEEIEANNGETVIETPLGENTYSTQYLQNPVLQAVHELLHEYGLGHSGSLYSRGSNLSGWTSGTNAGSASADNNQLDFSNYFSTGQYSEYITTDIMGYPSELEEGNTLNIAQMALLEWPEQILDKKTHIDLDTLDNGESVTFQAGDQQVALLHLDKPLPFPEGEYGNTTDSGESQIYNRLIFATNTYYDGSFGGIRVYVVGSRGNVIDLDAVRQRFDQDVSTYQFTMEGAIVTFEIGDTSATVSAVKTPVEPL